MSLLFLLIPIQRGAGSELNFYVEPIVPDSQIEGSTAYFNLNLPVGVEETLGLRLTNVLNESINIQVTGHTAYTNVNGVVEYGQDAAEPDPTLSYSLGDLLEIPEVVTLAPGEVRDLTVTLTMPEEPYTGLLAGGLRITEVMEEEENSRGEGLAIKNAFAYVIGVVVSNDRSNITPDLALLDVFADQLNYRNVFSATIQNYTPTFVNQLEVDAQILAAGSDEVLYEAQSTGMQMAPNSHFHYPISLNGDRFRNGNYVLTMTARSGDYEWSWEETFTVDVETARRLNREDVSIDNSLNIWMIVTIVLGVLFILIIGYLISNQKKLKKANEKDEK